MKVFISPKVFHVSYLLTKGSPTTCKKGGVDGFLAFQQQIARFLPDAHKLKSIALSVAPANGSATYVGPPIGVLE
jgi:hypothetical protein